MTTIQEIFEMRKNGNFEQAYNAVLPLYKEHHGHYTTLCMFWTATDVMRLRVDAGNCDEAERIFASLLHIYPNLQDKDYTAARMLNHLALQLATREQELHHQMPAQSSFTFSLIDHMSTFGRHYLIEEDWQPLEKEGHPMPSFAMRIVTRMFHEVSKDETCDMNRILVVMEMVRTCLTHTPRNKHLLRYQAYLTYLTGDKDGAIELYQKLLSRCHDAWLYSELASMVDNINERMALLAKAIISQNHEVFTQRDRLHLASLLAEQFPGNAAYELQHVLNLRSGLGKNSNRQIMDLQEVIGNVNPVTDIEQEAFYARLISQLNCAA